MRANNSSDEYDAHKKDGSPYAPFITAGCAVALAAVINLFVIINAIVPSASMEPAISGGQAVIGYRAAYAASQPERGDVIIFRTEQLGRVRLIKRVCAVPGDSVSISPVSVVINGEIYSEYPENDRVISKSFTVPDGCCVVLGDNSSQSFDSRCWDDPFVYYDDIIARAVFGYYPKFYKIN